MHSNRLQRGGVVAPTVIAPPAPLAVTIAPAFKARQKAWADAENNLVRKVAYMLTLAIVFIRFTGVHELLAAYVFDTHILYFLVPPALVAMLGSGGWRRITDGKPARYWLGFMVWLTLTIPLSSYKSGSLAVVFEYVRTEFVMLLLIAGTIMSWSEVRRLLQVLAFSAFFSIVMGRFLQSDQLKDRVELSTGTMSNANDFAAELVLILPFLLIALLTPKVRAVFRIAALAAMAYGTYLILSTGSRGAEVALVVAFAYCWVLAPGRWKFASIVALPLILIGLGMVLPHETIRRLMTLSTQSDSTDVVEHEAAGSAEARTYVLKQSFWFTLSHPLVGVGPGMFSDAEAGMASEEGRRGNWHETHNTYTQVSSEAGIPAFIFFIAALVSTFLLLRRMGLHARAQPPTKQNQAMSIAAFSVMVSLIGFCVAIFFLSLAYRFYLPAMSGIAIVMARAAEHEWSLAGAKPPFGRSAG